MNSDTFKDIEKLEADLWEAADNLRANSKLTSSDYFMPVLGVIFLRHAANRFEAAHRQIEADQASGKMPKRRVLPADYIARRSLYLPETARYDWILQQAAGSGAKLPTPVTDAMTAIESTFRAGDQVRRPRPEDQQVDMDRWRAVAARISRCRVKRDPRLP